MQQTPRACIEGKLHRFQRDSINHPEDDTTHDVANEILQMISEEILGHTRVQHWSLYTLCEWLKR